MSTAQHVRVRLVLFFPPPCGLMFIIQCSTQRSAGLRGVLGSMRGQRQQSKICAVIVSRTCQRAWLRAKAVRQSGRVPATDIRCDSALPVDVFGLAPRRPSPVPPFKSAGAEVFWLASLPPFSLFFVAIVPPPSLSAVYPFFIATRI